ncbi:unnamed protein product [Candidula unifasciata]|uniref:E3 ubiquitin-protein ligase ZSWIM2 n=1 Tax=Candidula unifasciata TaxID=100452 RepID=A0A8S3YKN7_9EUPU|nr:unnamed protein product [Candidula unifasciata]
MSRSVHWRMTVSDSCNWHQSQALDSTIYILRQTGPTGFLLKEEGETKNVKVFLGDPHSCTCQVFKKEKDLCKHICWLLLRKFKLSANNPLSWQLGLVEREINEILQGRVTSEQNRVKIQKKTLKVIDTSDGHNIVEQREIAEGDVCPICQEDLLTKKQLVTYCKFGCGNSIHIKCMRVWAEHQLKTSEDGKINCPMCREDFGSFDLLKTEMRNAGFMAPPAPGTRLDRHVGVACSHCSVTPIEGKCYRCTMCPDFFMCQKCFNTPVHAHHTFQFKQKRNQKWHSATRTLGDSLPDAIANDLMHRDLSENDYDLLLQLERNRQEELSNLSEEHLRAIPIERVKEAGPLLALGCQCRVCLRGFTVGQFVRKLPCKHKFHKDCIDNWLLHSHPICPIDGILAVPSRSAVNASQARTMSIDQPQVSNPNIGDLTLTAFGIPVATSRLRAASTVATVSIDQCSTRRTYPRSSSFVRLELSGLPIGNDSTSNQGQHLEVAEERPAGNCLLQQAAQHRERMSEQVRKMQRTISTDPNPNELLPPEALIGYLQSQPQSRQAIKALDNSGRHGIKRPSIGSASSLKSDLMNQHHGLQRRPWSLLRGRSNSSEKGVPSIQNGRKVVGDLFLGNNPMLQPPVNENWSTSKPPANMKSRRQLFRSNFHNVSSVRHVEHSRNVDMALEGSTVDNNTSGDQ